MTIPKSVTDAVYHTVHDYPGGAPSLAPRIGIASARVLDNKVNPNSRTHHLTLDEAVKVMAFSGDMRILHALADRFEFLIARLRASRRGTAQPCRAADR